MELTTSVKRPILGILLDAEVASRFAVEHPDLGLCLQMDAAEKGEVTAYYFTLGDINPAEMAVLGWVYEDSQWQRCSCSWPDILYDLARKVSTEREHNLLQNLYATAVPINSTRILGKWFTYSILAQSPELRPMLPSSVEYRQPEDLMAMLEKYHSVYLKPEWGSGGRGIVRIWASDDGSWRYKESVTGEERLGLTCSELLSLVGRDTIGRDMVVQQEIPLYEYEGRRCDIRATMRRNRKGEWQFDSGGVRRGQPGAIVTNWVRGGEWIPFPDGLNVYQAATRDTKALLARVERASLQVAKRLEEQVGPMGELGLDWAFDQNLNLWFLEANPMPTKSAYMPVNGIPHPQYRNVVEYAVYLYDRMPQKAGEEGGDQRV